MCLISRVFANRDFGYRTITIERPVRDAHGAVIVAPKGKTKGQPQADAALRDSENVPLHEDVDAYFAREVRPHAPMPGSTTTRPKWATKSPLIATSTSILHLAHWPPSTPRTPNPASRHRAPDCRQHQRGCRMSQSRYDAYKDSGVAWLGQVPAHWEVKKIKSLTKFSSGGTPSRNEPSFWNGDIPWVSAKDMKSKFIGSSEEYITQEGLQNTSGSIIAEGAVLMVVRSGILKHTIPVAINTVPVTINQDLKCIVLTNECTNIFFYYRITGNNSLLLHLWSEARRNC
jgi:hypothetical protein